MKGERGKSTNTTGDFTAPLLATDRLKAENQQRYTTEKYNQLTRSNRYL